ncbi:MAG: cyclohexanecarboxyl-CoA dehydrogenase [Deltaproteobacteria bacterium]|nr:MAG: cyclohexanecarboxyl-CoA dehydrogenase [Deltaproteobacteria bacterium]
MDFHLSEQQKAMVETMSAFARKELFSESANIDKSGEFPRDLFRKMADLGLTSVNIPEKYGGLGLDYLTIGMIFEEIAKGDMCCATILSIQILMNEVIKIAASEEMKTEWFPKIVKGEKITAGGITEPGAGTDAAAMVTKAEKDGDSYRINGEKSGMSLASVADAMIIFAVTDPSAGARGVSAFMVPTDLNGITIQTYEDSGIKGVRRGSAFFDDVSIPSRNLIGAEGDGFRKIMVGFDFTRVILGLMALGSAQISIEETIGYLKERHAFGKPLAKFEGVSFPVAEHITKLQAARLLSYHALWLRDQGLPHTSQAAMAKVMAPSVAVAAIHDCVLLHGHYGYTNEFPFEQRLRDVMGMEIADGTTQVCKIVIGREVFGREFLPY